MKCLLLAFALLAPPLHAQYADISQQRIDEIAAMLPDHTEAMAPVCSDRAAWDKIAPTLSASIEHASTLVGKPFPAWSDEDYLDYFKSGSRDRAQAMMGARHAWLPQLVLAECAENKGRFLPTIAMVLEELAMQKSWTLVAHDVNQDYVTGRRYFVELVSADLADTMSTSLYLLGDKIPAATRKHVTDVLEQRVFKPMRTSYTTGKGQTWLRVESNWNAVCLAGVTGAALAILPDRKDRAFFVAAAEYYQQFYLKSFPADGFEVEGVGYWNYGFSHYALLREELWRATSGKIDLFQDAKVQKVARFGVDFQMLPHVLAYFSDSPFGSQPDPQMSAYVARIFGIDTGVGQGGYSGSRETQMMFALMRSFPSSSEIHTPLAKAQDDFAFRTFYPVSGVLVSRPGDRKGLAITIKGTGNGPHSHNDVGSYAVGLVDAQPLGEPGGPGFYTAQTFSKDRFLSKLLNSYGHPVPVIDGHLQRDALKVNVPPAKTTFTPDEDTISLNITDAYDTPTLKGLTRTMTHSRLHGGSIVLSDAYTLSAPTIIEEALITHGDWKQLDPNTIEFTQNNQTVRASIICPEPFTISSEMVKEYNNPFTRIAVKTQLKDGETFRLKLAPAGK